MLIDLLTYLKYYYKIQHLTHYTGGCCFTAISEELKHSPKKIVRCCLIK